MTEGQGKLVVGNTAGEIPDKLLGRSHTLGRHVPEVECLPVAERADGQSPQHAEMGTAAEPGAEVGRQHPHVGARRALDENAKTVGFPRFVGVEVEHLDRSGGALDLDTLPGELVQAAPPTFTAETMGGTWLIRPVSERAASRTSSSLTPPISKWPVTSPEASSVEVVVPKATSPT